MDYVQSVLVRQQRLLSLLLLGGRQETGEKTEGQRQATYMGPEAQDAPAVSAFQRFFGEDAEQSEKTAEENFWPGVSAARFQESPEHSVAARRQAELQAAQRRYGRMSESGTAYMTGGEIPGDGGVRAAGAWSATAAGVGRRDAQAAPAAAGGAWQEALSARDVSLAFERDARRYDGGFSLY